MANTNDRRMANRFYTLLQELQVVGRESLLSAKKDDGDIDLDEIDLDFKVGKSISVNEDNQPATSQL